ncbi:ABC transporter ATP-binding protein [bacterium]|nr:ABC transporter ATP-binding protein [bacterium]
MILQTVRLSKNFAGLVALSNVDLTVAQGEIFGIAGPNGAGKSTLFNVIAGTFPPSTGEIFFAGHNITRLKSHQICHLGLGRTFQIPATFPTLSVYDNLRVGAVFGSGSVRGLTNHRAVAEQIRKTLSFLDLTACQDQPATNLDIYSMKLVMLGSILCTDCQVIMLDEPLAGLSILEIRSFLDLIRRINQEMGITVIIIEHLLDMLIEISQRMMILHNGKIIFLGEPEAVRETEEVINVYLGTEE